MVGKSKQFCIEFRSPDQLIPSAFEASQTTVPGGYRLFLLARGHESIEMPGELNAGAELLPRACF